MSRYLCWCDDGGDGVANATEYEARDELEAAIDCAAIELDESNGESPPVQVIHVRDESGAWHVFDVETDYPPSFTAVERS